MLDTLQWQSVLQIITKINNDLMPNYSKRNLKTDMEKRKNWNIIYTVTYTL